MRAILAFCAAVALAACQPASNMPPPDAPAGQAPEVNNILGLTLETELSPQLVQDFIAKHGAAGVVRNLADYPPGNGDFGFWAKVTDKIKAGDAAWVALAPALQPGADGALGEGLTLALQAALATNPSAVLALPNPPYPVETLCTVGLIEPTPEQLKAAKDAAITAVSKLADPALAKAKAACLAELAKVKAP